MLGVLFGEKAFRLTSETERMAADLSRTGPIERDVEQVLLF